MSERNVWLLIFFSIVALAFFGVYSVSNKNNRTYAVIQEMGYDIKDVDVFLQSIGCRRSEFIASEGLRNQYATFRSGQVTDFMKTAKNKKSSGSDLAVGMALGMGMRR